LLFGIAVPAITADVLKVPVPSSPYLPVIYRFADAMIERGRDVYGPEKTGLFLSALDRGTMGLLTNAPSAPAANPQHHQNFLRLLYTLSELSSKPKYRDAANAELKWLVESAHAADLLTRRDGSWDVLGDKPSGRKTLFFKSSVGWYRPWMLWEQSFAVAPAASARVATTLIDHARKNEAANALGPREAGFYIRAWAVAYSHTTNENYLKAIEALLDKRGKDEQRDGDVRAALALAIDCNGAAHHVPGPLAARLRDAALRNDRIFLRPGHDVQKQHGFFSESHMGVGVAVTSLWDDRSDTTAKLGMLCVARYENTGDIKYRDLMHAAADAYFDLEPDKVADVSPMNLGHAISLQVAAWRSTAQPRYLERARYFGDWALKTFFDAPLPRASVKSNHYEAITGADTLALALMELHLNILGITAVRCPSNTIDR
jgi:hypothetical protein